MKVNIFKNTPTFRLWAGTVLVFGMVVSAFTSTAQEKADNPALFKVVYEFTHVDDSTQRDRPLQEEMNLYINGTSSLYRRFHEEDGEYHRHRQRGGSAETFDLNLILENTSSLYHSLSEQKMVNTERIATQMLQIRESMPAIDWEIGDEQKQIGDYTAQLARGSFGGRDYQVWFVPEIPIPFGPWKLQGLPGLILEARDSKDDVVFTFKSLEQMGGPKVNLIYPEGIKQVTGAEFTRTYKAFRDNPEAFYRATAGSGVRIGVAVGAVGSMPARAKVYNNPMELNNR